MIVEIQDVNFERYDVIVAGSGPAGSTVARKLSQRGRRVLILETGGRDFDDAIQTGFATIRGRGHFDGGHWAQHWLRALGGTSWAWAGWCAPLLERNLASWPISRGDLDPYYRQAAELLRRPLRFLDYAAGFVDGFEYRPTSAEPPLRFGETDLYTDDANVDVLLNCTVTGLQPRDDRRAITGLALWSPGAGSRAVTLGEAQVLVLAAGAIGNAQVLLASRPGDGAAVGNENDQVGRGLMEHPHFYNCARIVVPAEAALPVTPMGFGESIPMIVPDESVFASIGGLDMSIELIESLPATKDPVEVFLLGRIGGGARTYDLTVRAEMTADPDNRVTLDDERDPAGLPRPRTDCIVGAGTLRAVDRCLEALGAALTARGAGRLRIVNEALYGAQTGGGHTMGTTRMGADPRTSVVDRDCRVHGYRNLYVAGSSVFATGGYANPTLSIMALAARLADHLADAA